MRRRNGKSEEVLSTKWNPVEVPPRQRSCRIARSKLVSALLESVDQDHVHLSKRLIGVEQRPDGKVGIRFDDSPDDVSVDLVIAADGIRSVGEHQTLMFLFRDHSKLTSFQRIRQTCFPEHALSYNGQTVYRTIISKAEVKRQIKDFPWVPTFWKRVSGLYVFTSPLGGDDFEVTARIRRPHKGEDPVSWGRPVDFHEHLHEYADFSEQVQQILRLSAKGATQEFALFSGPRLNSVVSGGNIAFIGDASHALLGNFGSGAALALEDAYTLACTIKAEWSSGQSLAAALSSFDSSRSPEYEKLYRLIDKFTAIKNTLWEENLPIDTEIEQRIRRIADAAEPWIFS